VPAPSRSSILEAMSQFLALPRTLSVYSAQSARVDRKSQTNQQSRSPCFSILLCKSLGRIQSRHRPDLALRSDDLRYVTRQGGPEPGRQFARRSVALPAHHYRATCLITSKCMRRILELRKQRKELGAMREERCRKKTSFCLTSRIGDRIRKSCTAHQNHNKSSAAKASQEPRPRL
jgi:hypothetical protein